MNWSDVKQNTDIQRPYDGSIRYRSMFLLWPKKIGHVTRWLEFARWSEQYKWWRKEYSEIRGYWVDQRHFKWEPIQWED